MPRTRLQPTSKQRFLPVVSHSSAPPSPLAPDKKTEINAIGDGRYIVAKLSRERLVGRVAISVIRLTIAGFMFYQGTLFLVYTISISDLLLNAVALAFVISMDELLFISCAPARAKRIVQNTAGFTLKPEKTWKGQDLRSVLTVLSVMSAMLCSARRTHPLAASHE